MILNLLISAASSPNQNQRNESLQILGNEFKLKGQLFLDEIFNLLCSQDRMNHVLSYSFLKKMIREADQSKLSDLNQYMEKSFIFWYEKQRNRNSFDQAYNFQRDNIIELNARFLSLNNSARYRQSLIDTVPFKICQSFTKSNKNQLYMYLCYYGHVLQSLNRYRIGSINSKKGAMGSVMLAKITTRLNPQNSMEASLWVNFSVNFSKFSNWIPDKSFLIKCLIQYSLTNDSLMTLLDYLSTNMKIVWILEDYCKILQGLQKIMFDCQKYVQKYTCKEVETILKCLRSFLHSFFTCNTKIQNAGDAMISQYIYSYQQFEKTSFFLINMIDYFSSNSEQESIGNLSHMIVEYSTQILRLYSTYLDEEAIQKYAKGFMNNFSNSTSFQIQKLLIFFSSLPKTVLQMFEYDKFVSDILSANIQLSQNYQPVYVNFLTHYIGLNDYIDFDLANKLAGFFFHLIQSRHEQIQLFDCRNIYVPESISNLIQRVSLSVYGLSKMGKYREFTMQNLNYFTIIVDTIFEIMLKSTNDFSIIVQSINQLIQCKRPEWDQVIFEKTFNCLLFIQNFDKRLEKVIFNQIQIQLYRVIRRTISMEQIFGKIQSLWINQTQSIDFTLSSCLDLKNICLATNLDQKSEAVKEEIIFFFEEILVQFNRINHQGKFKPIERLLIQFSQTIITQLLFDQLFVILQDTTQLESSEKIIQNNIFEKVEFATEQYTVVEAGYSKQLHLTCIKILLELSLYEQFIETVFMIVNKLNSKYLLCLWEAIEIIYPGRIEPILIPVNVKQRLDKMRAGHLVDLFQTLQLNQQNHKIKSTPSWYELYRNILREDSIVIDIIHQKFTQFIEG